MIMNSIVDVIIVSYARLMYRVAQIPRVAHNSYSLPNCLSCHAQCSRSGALN